jgi:hypothetical protein
MLSGPDPIRASFGRLGVPKHGFMLLLLRMEADANLLKLVVAHKKMTT